MHQRNGGRHGFVNAYQAAEDNGGKKEETGEDAGGPFHCAQWRRLGKLVNPDGEKNEHSKSDQLVDIEENCTIWLSGMVQPVA